MACHLLSDDITQIHANFNEMERLSFNKIFIIGCPESCQNTNFQFSADSGENFIKMTYKFQLLWSYSRLDSKE